MSQNTFSSHFPLVWLHNCIPNSSSPKWWRLTLLLFTRGCHASFPLCQSDASLHLSTSSSSGCCIIVHPEWQSWELIHLAACAYCSHRSHTELPLWDWPCAQRSTEERGKERRGETGSRADHYRFCHRWERIMEEYHTQIVITKWHQNHFLQPSHFKYNHTWWISPRVTVSLVWDFKTQRHWWRCNDAG